MPGAAFFIHAQLPPNSKCHVKAHCKLFTYTRDACGLESRLMKIPQNWSQKDLANTAV